jgi:hypothetical protein
VLLKHPPFTLIDAASGVLSVNAFHEKAGRSQVVFLVFSLNKVFLFPPSGHCRHASIRTLEERFHFARCMLGVLVTAGAAICLSPCGSALSEWNLGQAINAVTGTRLWLLIFPSQRCFCFYAAVASGLPWLLCSGSYASPLTHR